MSKRIPVRNIYYMLCYAWNLLNEIDEVDSSDLTGVDAYNLFARVLTCGVERLIKRGLGRGYSSIEEDSQVIRGKVDFTASIKRQTLLKLQLACHYEVMDHNTVLNKIIKATMARLLSYEALHIENRGALFHVYRYFGQIDDIVLTYHLFSSIQFGRSNAQYEMLIRICEMIFQNTAVDENTGKIRFMDFERDKRFWQLFEHFVFNFYKKHIGDQYRISHGTQVAWALDSFGQEGKYLPIMTTDVMLENRERRLIIDTKYYPEALVEKYEECKKLRSDHLYQIYAYVRNSVATAAQGQRVDGMLLYPRVQENVDCDYEIQGHLISIKMVDLNDCWENIHKRLMEIVKASH